MRLALIGYGKMGHAVEAVALEEGHEVVARLDEGDAVTGASLAGAEVAVDFTTPEAAPGNIRALSSLGVDLVVGTTGWYDHLEDARAVVDAAGTGLIWAPNFSLGVQLFYRLVRAAGRLVDRLEGYDVFVHEVHHRHKLDHPSGTAKKVAEILLEEVGRKERWEETPPRGAPVPEVLLVGSSRAGEVPGTHWVGMEGPDDSIELRHTARGRTGFARGAVAAAGWIRGRKGCYGIEDMLSDRLGHE